MFLRFGRLKRAAASNNQMIDCHNHLGAELGAYLRSEFPYGQHLTTLVEDGAKNGIKRFVVFPMVANLSLNLSRLMIGEVSLEGGLESVPYAFENRRMMQEIHEYFPEDGAKTIPFVMLDPARKQTEQVAALRALREEYDFYGLKIQSTMLQAPITSLQGEGGVFVDLAREWKLPFLIHSSVLPTDVWAQASDIIDIAGQTPDVRFCVAHSCRFDRVQLDRIAQLDNCWFDCSAHGIHCDLAAQNSPVVAPPERRFPSDYRDRATVLHNLAQAYPDKLMWGSDSPYYSFVAGFQDQNIALLSSYREEADYLHALPEELKTRAGQTNTLNCLDLNS